MDSKVLSELARAWYARAEKMNGPRDGAEDAQHANGVIDGKALQLEECAKQLESVIALYSPLSS